MVVWSKVSGSLVYEVTDLSFLQTFPALSQQQGPPQGMSTRGQAEDICPRSIQLAPLQFPIRMHCASCSHSSNLKLLYW